jgi:hypothetical protein
VLLSCGLWCREGLQGMTRLQHWGRKALCNKHSVWGKGTCGREITVCTKKDRMGREEKAADNRQCLSMVPTAKHEIQANNSNLACSCHQSRMAFSSAAVKTASAACTTDSSQRLLMSVLVASKPATLQASPQTPPIQTNSTLRCIADNEVIAGA